MSKRDLAKGKPFHKMRSLRQAIFSPLKRYLWLFILSLCLNACALNWGIQGDGETWAADEIVPSDVITYISLLKSRGTLMEKLLQPQSEQTALAQEPVSKLNPNNVIFFIYPTGHFKLLTLVYSPILAKKSLEGAHFQPPI